MFDTLLIAHSKRFFKETVWKSNYCPAFVCLFIYFYHNYVQHCYCPTYDSPLSAACQQGSKSKQWFQNEPCKKAHFVS